jgi:hypothetical protein
MENWKSKSRIPTFPYSVYLSLKLKMKGESIPPVTLVVQAHLKIGKRSDSALPVTVILKHGDGFDKKK